MSFIERQQEISAKLTEGSQAEAYEKVNHPAHYQSKAGMEVIDVIEAFELDFPLGTAAKYLLRAGKKPGEAAVVDLKKCLWYINRKIEQLTKAG